MHEKRLAELEREIAAQKDLLAAAMARMAELMAECKELEWETAPDETTDELELRPATNGCPD